MKRRRSAPRLWSLPRLRGRGEHRYLRSGSGLRPTYSRKMNRMLTRLFR